MNVPLRICAVIPTYRNAGTVVDVIRRVLLYVDDVIVVCDGCTDGTQEKILQSGLKAEVISYPANRGKGHALKTGFRRAIDSGFDYALTIDSDGQHFPEDIPFFLDRIETRPGVMVVGSRNLQSENMPGGNTFANRFSNFWFRVQTGVHIPDTQSGFRAYPLHGLSHVLPLLTSRYEAELELLVHYAWIGAEIESIPINVHYPQERVSSFRPFRDFMRISALNTVLCLLTPVYGYPRRLIGKIRK